jgi:hypothetical protein
MAVMFHEVCKPTECDEDMHNQMDVSYAANSFNIVKIARRRECCLH